MRGNRDRTPGQEHDLEDTFAGIAGRSINRLNNNGVSVWTASAHADATGAAEVEKEEIRRGF
jgi:hypothetical protein